MRATMDSKLVDQARTFQTIAWVAVVAVAVQLLALLGLLTLISPIADAMLRGDRDTVFALGGPVLVRLIGFLPVLCYLGGLIAAAEIFGRVAEGELFSEANSKGLAKVGAALIEGAVAAAVIVPVIQLWVSEGPGGFDMRLEPETWVIAVIGGAILVLGRMMARATALEAEAATLRSELDEIV